MKVCLCVKTFNKIIKWALDGGMPSKILGELPQKTLKSLKGRTKRFGVKRITRLKKKHFSRKQLAAQRLFAKRARAGTLRKRRRRGTR